MKITALVENTSARGLETEHGLSLFVEADNCRFLFDMGQSDLFARNAEALGVDLNAVDFAVLSHGHYDHGGGIGTFLRLNDHAPVYVSPHAFEPHFHGREKYIGLDPALARSDRIVRAPDGTAVAPGCAVHAREGARSVVPLSPAGLSTLRDGALVPEDFRHEQYLLVEVGGRRVLFSGCSHRGILNIVEWFRPDALVGGFHLFNHPIDTDLAAIAKALDARPTVYYTGHCTGEAQYAFMKRYMRNLRYLSAGDSATL